MRAVLLAAVLAVTLAAQASAFDAGPHTDITRDALTAEGFSGTAADVGVVENWFVDYYWNAKTNPFSGHANVIITLLSHIDIQAIEFWDPAIIRGTNHMHFDSGESGFPNLATTEGVDFEWQRLMRITKGLLEKADDPLTVDAIIGMSLHSVQDFYAHTDWVETAGQFGSPDGPGWDETKYGRYPTYFDIPKTVRDTKTIYSAVTDQHRGHGKWNTTDKDKNQTLATGMNKDWPGRPLYEKTYVTAYFATRQWIRAARGWLNNDALWSRAQRLSSPRGLSSDLRGSYDISRYSGHWQGSGEPCKKVIVACGDQYGWAGSVFSLRHAIKDYHENYSDLLRASAPRKRFESIVPAYYDNPSGNPVPEPAPSTDIQAATNFVKLEVTRMRGYDWALGDPGPDDADLYTSARIRGQRYASTTIHDHDQFGFSRPYAPFTWIRSVPVGWRASEPVRKITVRVQTGDRRFAGTDDNVYLRLASGLRFDLDKGLYNDFERGDDDTYAVPLDQVTHAGLALKDLEYAQLEKGRDGPAGGWYVHAFTVKVNGKAIASPTVNRWFEDNHRSYRANITRDHRTSNVVQMWIRLKEDDYLYGADDDGDINNYDRNQAVALRYSPCSSPVELELTGGKDLAGRRSLENGEKGKVWIRMSSLPCDSPVTPTPTPTATPTPSATSTPTPSPTATPQPGKADLVITEFTTTQVTVMNQGSKAAGAFSVGVQDFPNQPVSGLAAGQSATVNYGNSCNHDPRFITATADVNGQVNESNESNNTMTLDTACIAR
ncbi:MAG: hypothetical protein QOF76_2069 [Solirubrobacteraceae bacterium]|nr:hypothetical protein [Solirubrobacteraceae bacterium]